MPVDGGEWISAARRNRTTSHIDTVGVTTQRYRGMPTVHNLTLRLGYGHRAAMLHGPCSAPVQMPNGISSQKKIACASQ